MEKDELKQGIQSVTCTANKYLFESAQSNTLLTTLKDHFLCTMQEKIESVTQLLKETRNSYFGVTPKNHRLMFVS